MSQYLHSLFQWQRCSLLCHSYGGKCPLWLDMLGCESQLCHTRAAWFIVTCKVGVVLGELGELIHVKPSTAQRPNKQCTASTERCWDFPIAHSKAFFPLNFGQFIISIQYFPSEKRVRIFFSLLLLSTSSQPQALLRCPRPQNHFRYNQC